MLASITAFRLPSLPSSPRPHGRALASPARGAALVLVLAAACGCSGAAAPTTGVGQALAAAAREDGGETRRFASKHGEVRVFTVASGLENPWALAFLPDGKSALVTERPGRLRLMDLASGKVGAPIAGVPAVAARGQGGLLDVVLAPDFAQSRRVFLSYSEPRGDGGENATAVGSATLSADGSRLDGWRVLFQQQPAVDSGHHFGSRLVFDRAGALFVTLGERNSAREQAQNLANHIGKVVRLDPATGAPAKGNPFLAGTSSAGAKAQPAIWSYGHRNVQGAALHPVTGSLWTHEHGPKGGDEVNLTQAGRNYGWPVITYGREYSGGEVGDGISKRAGMEQPLHTWVPSIAPSGMAFYTADRYPMWKGSLFVGSLKFGQLARLTLDSAGERVTGEERLLEGLNQRIRDVRQGPDGALYLVTDEGDGQVLRVELGAAGS